MKRHFLYIYAVTLCLLSLSCLSGCSDDSDDVRTIFTGKVWKMSYIFRDGNAKSYVNFWLDDREAEAKSVAARDIAGNYEIEFMGAHTDGTFSGTVTGKVINSTFEGTWRANGKNQQISIGNLKWNGEETDVLAKAFQQGMTNAFKYTGDANALYIYYKDGELVNVIALLPKNIR